MAALGSSVEGARVLDLFAGSGALGLEALSRGAEHVVFVERSAGSLSSLQSNVRTLGAGGHVKVVRADAIAYARGLPPGAFDIALADPPYEGGLASALATAYWKTPFASELWVEHRTSERLGEVPHARQRTYGDTTLTTFTAP
jgi:16S rRNA (guanine966-N2)-methyltransferase